MRASCVADEGTTSERITEVVDSTCSRFAARRADPPRVDGEKNPKTYVWSPHHQHSFERPEVDQYAGEFPGLNDLRESYPSWLENGLRGEIADGTVYDPWVMAGVDGRTDWWERSGLSGGERLVRQVYLTVGLGQAGGSDLT
jgi:hypothetical protein